MWRKARARIALVTAAGGVAVALVTYGNTTVVTAATKSPIAQEQKLSRAKQEKAAKKKLNKALKACKKKTPKSKASKCAKKAHKRYTKTIKRLKRKPRPKGTTTSPPATTAPATTAPATTAPATTAPATTGTAGPTTTGAAGPTTTGTAGPTTTTTSAGPTTTGPTEAKPTQAEVTAGKGLFESNGCASCHGALGEGKSGLAPAYGPELPRSMTIMGVVEQLTTPLNEVGCKCMSAYPKLSTAEKEEIGAYVTVELTKTVAIGGGPGPGGGAGTAGPTTTTTSGPTTTTSGPTTTTSGPTTTTGPTTTGSTTGPHTETKAELERFVEDFVEASPPPALVVGAQVEKGHQIFSNLSCSACHGTPGNPGEYDLEELPRAKSVKGVMEQIENPDGGMPEFWNASTEIQTKEGLEAIGDYVCVKFSPHTCEEAH